MILRSVTSHFRRQEWTAIFLDFAIVVFGVFVGLQVDNWNAAQAEKRLGQSYIDRLVIDLQEDLKTKNRFIDYYDSVYDSAERAVALLNTETPDARALVINAYRATEYSYEPPKRATWDTIISSGSTGLLPQRAVGRGLSAYYTYDTALMISGLIQASEYRHIIRRLIPHRLQKAIREHCGDIRGSRQEIIGFQNECTLGVDETILETAAITLKENRAVIESLRYQFTILENARLNLRGDIAYLERAIDALGK